MTESTSFHIFIRFLILIIVGLFVLLLLSYFHDNPRNKFEVNNRIFVNNINAVIVDKLVISVRLETENTTQETDEFYTADNSTNNDNNTTTSKVIVFQILDNP